MTEVSGGTPYLRQANDALELLVYVSTRASQSRIAGEHNGRLKIAVAAPAVEGKANEELQRFIADLFDIPKRAVLLRFGQSSKNKSLRLEGISLRRALECLRSSLQK
jgi:uncharacterized protein